MGRLSTLVLCLFVSFPFSNLYAEQKNCNDQFLQGTAPQLHNAKLQAKTQMLCYTQIALLYSAISKTPLWSAEHLTVDRIQSAHLLTRLRSNAFHPEPALISDDRAELYDYKNSGFDRGHMAPNGDMSTPEAQEESFSLANMIPQHPCNNEVLWEGIESAVRDLTITAGEVYVVTGPAFLGNKLSSLKGRVLVPTHVFKAIYVPSLGQAAAYFAPNDASQAWEAISVSELSTRIGIDVFPSLPTDLKNRIAALPQPIPHFGCRIQTTDVTPQTTQGPTP